MNVQLHTTYSRLLKHRNKTFDTSISKKQNFYMPKYLTAFFALITFFTGLPFFVTAQPALPSYIDVNTPGYLDFTVPSDIVDIYVTVSGAEGGGIDYRCSAHGGWGKGLQAHFPVSYCLPQAILPGGTLRLIVGAQGESVRKEGQNGAGGGGGSALVYKPASGTQGVLLIVAG